MSGPAPRKPEALTPEQALALRKVQDGRRHDTVARALRIAGIAFLTIAAAAAVVIAGMTIVRSLRGLDTHLQEYDGQARGAAAGGDDDAERAPALRGSRAHQADP